MVKRIFIMAIMVVVALSLIAPNTYAIPTLQLTDPMAGLPVIVQDGSPLDLNPIVGAVTYVGTVPSSGIGTWNLNVTTGVTKPEIGDSVQMSMDLNSIDATSVNGGTLIIQFSDDNFGPGTGSFITEIGGTLGGGPGSSLVYNTYLDTGNILFGEGTPLTSQTFNSSPFLPAFASASVGSFAAPASLTQKVTIVHTRQGLTSFDATLNSVPEPSSALLLLGLLLGGIGGVGLLKKKEEI
ncbi:MAG: LPXTG cell wall anchor domain-containing protein [bacterium]